MNQKRKMDLANLDDYEREEGVLDMDEPPELPDFLASRFAEASVSAFENVLKGLGGPISQDRLHAMQVKMLTDDVTPLISRLRTIANGGSGPATLATICLDEIAS